MDPRSGERSKDGPRVPRGRYDPDDPSRSIHQDRGAAQCGDNLIADGHGIPGNSGIHVRRISSGEGVSHHAPDQKRRLAPRRKESPKVLYHRWECGPRSQKPELLVISDSFAA